jgi:hypothetical protein
VECLEQPLTYGRPDSVNPNKQCTKSTRMGETHLSYVDWNARAPGSRSARHSGNRCTSSATRGTWYQLRMPMMSTSAGAVRHSRTNTSALGTEGFGDHYGAISSTPPHETRHRMHTFTFSMKDRISLIYVRTCVTGVSIHCGDRVSF